MNENRPRSPAIEVSSLSIAYGAKIAVRDVSFSVDFGEIVAMIGPNGAGKTSTLETIEGFKAPTGGSVRVLELDPHGNQHRLARQVGIMLQSGGLYPAMTPKQLVRLFQGYYQLPGEIDEFLDRLDLVRVQKTPYRRLSGGEQKKLLLALALIGSPRVLVLDEPTSGVDLYGRLAIRDILANQRMKGVCVLYATHELAEAERVADRVVIINQGTVVAQGQVGELLTRFGASDLEGVFTSSLDFPE